MFNLRIDYIDPGHAKTLKHVRPAPDVYSKIKISLGKDNCSKKYFEDLKGKKCLDGDVSLL